MALKDTMQRRSRGAKLNALVGMLSLKLAARNNDALYQKYSKLRRAYLTVKQSIAKKYGNKALMVARKIASGGGGMEPKEKPKAK
jgi:hypothetical protein